MIKKLFIIMFLICIMFNPSKFSASATSVSAYETFKKKVDKELKAYIKKSGGDITLKYRDLESGKEYQLNSSSPRAAASTIKLPLAIYVMELASKEKINLNEKLTYKKHHYYGGSGVIQYDKVGSKYTIRDLVKKAMIYSDNIAFIMLREDVGKQNFIDYMKQLGGQFAYPNGQNKTSSKDLITYAQKLYDFSEKNKLGQELVGYLKNTIYNTTIPKGIKNIEIAHKVGMIPMSQVSNDVGIIYDRNPYALAILTNKLSYAKSQKVIADIASIVHKHHQEKNKALYFKTIHEASIYVQKSGTYKKMGSIPKGEYYQTSSIKGKWYEMVLGSSKVYISKKDVISYTKVYRTFTKEKIKNNGILNSKEKVYVTSALHSKGKRLATIDKNTKIPYQSVEDNHYKIIIGNRIGYVFFPEKEN